LGVLGGTLFAALLGYIVGCLAIRRQGIYFAMVTLALAQIVYFVALKAPLTGGEDGLQGIPRGDLFGMIDLGRTYTVGGSPLGLNLYYFIFVIVLPRFLVHLPDDQFTFWPGAEGDS